MSSVLVDLGARATCHERSPALSSDHTISPSNILKVDNYDSSVFYAALTAPHDLTTTTSHNYDLARDCTERSMQSSCDPVAEDNHGSSEDVQRPVKVSLPDWFQPLYAPDGKWNANGFNLIVDWEELATLPGSSCYVLSFRL
jgi:hypothetical protein